MHLSDYNDLLKENDVYDVSMWRKILYLSDVRNKCDHDKGKEPTKEEVKDLIDGWKEIHEILDGMSGAAKDAHELYTVQCIQGKFEVAMGNINERLKPACVAITLLYTTSNLINISGIDGGGGHHGILGGCPHRHLDIGAFQEF